MTTVVDLFASYQWGIMRNEMGCYSDDESTWVGVSLVTNASLDGCRSWEEEK